MSYLPITICPAPSMSTLCVQKCVTEETLPPLLPAPETEPCAQGLYSVQVWPCNKNYRPQASSGLGDSHCSLTARAQQAASIPHHADVKAAAGGGRSGQGNGEEWKQRR